jgi:hypothetical protein
MLEVYGHVFRRQEQSRPWWWTTLIVLGTVVGMFYLMMISYWIGHFAMWCVKSQPESRQLPVARLAGLVLGTIALWVHTGSWRQRLFLAAPIRDLASTPGSAWHVFRVAIRMKWWNIASVPTVLFTVALFPWFYEGIGLLRQDLAWASAEDPAWIMPAEWLGYFDWLLAALGAAAAWLLLQAVFTVTAIALNLAFSGLGLGGVAPRTALVGRLLSYAIWLLGGLGLLAGLATIGFWMASPPEPPGPEWWRLGQWCDSVLSCGHTLSACIRWFPGVAIGEVLHGLVLSDRSVGPNWFGLLAWGGGAVAVACIAFRSGYSHTARCGLDREVTSVTPADAKQAERPGFNPDRINGPFEKLLIAWLGRMGRAVLRLVTVNAQSGAIDRILLRTLAAGGLALLLGYGAMWLVPRAFDVLLSLYRIGLAEREVNVIRSIVAVLALIVLTIYCIAVWGGPRVWRTGLGNGAFSRDAQTEGPLGSWSKLFRRRKATTRGDQRYPLSEIYAVGFSDAVLVPSLYTGFWLTATAGVVWGAGFLLGLPLTGMNWAVAIGLPGLWQLAFLSYLGMASNYWTHYRRSLLYQIFMSVWMCVLAAVGVLTVLALIVGLWVLSHRAGYPHWMPWLGTVNILVIADLAQYMLVRWLYVRRRFDAEYRHPVSMA